MDTDDLKLKPFAKNVMVPVYIGGFWREFQVPEKDFNEMVKKGEKYQKVVEKMGEDFLTPAEKVEFAYIKAAIMGYVMVKYNANISALLLSNKWVPNAMVQKLSYHKEAKKENK